MAFKSASVRSFMLNQGMLSGSRHLNKLRLAPLCNSGILVRRQVSRETYTPRPRPRRQRPIRCRHYSLALAVFRRPRRQQATFPDDLIAISTSRTRACYSARGSSAYGNRYIRPARRGTYLFQPESVFRLAPWSNPKARKSTEEQE